jgi:predicted MFS family arabinose efflux permease
MYSRKRREPSSLISADSLPHPASQAGEAEVGFLPVLKNLNFLTLWCGQVFSQLADKIYLVLMIAIISSQFQQSGQSISAWVSALMIVFTIPAVLFGFAAGVFVDRWRKKRVLVVTNLLRGVLVFSLPWLLLLSADWQPIYSIPEGFLLLLSVTFLVSTLTQFFAPAEQAVIPLLVERRHLLSANSLYTTTMMASVIVGFALGEPLLEWAGNVMEGINARIPVDLGSGKEVFVGLCYVLAGLCLLMIRPKETEQPRDQRRSHLLTDMKDGLRFLSNHPRVRSALVQLVILFSVFAALAVLAVRLAELIPSIDADQFGFLLASAGVGMALGAAMIGQFGQRIRRSLMSLVGSIGMAACLALLSLFTQQLWPSLITIGVLGACAAVVGIPMQTTIQAETPETMRGKVFGLQNNAVNIALSLPLALAGIAETLFGLPMVLLTLSAIILSGGLLTWYSSRMSFKRIES